MLVIDFRGSAEKMASRLRMLKKHQQQQREMGNRSITVHIDELFDAGDQAALDAYEHDLLLHSGAQPLPFGDE